MGPTEAIARFLTSTKAEEIPCPVLQSAKQHVVDTLGVALGASKGEIAAILEKVVKARQEGEASLWTGSGRSGAADAAWVNGTLSHALDFDDGGVALTPMHPSAPVLSAVLALAEARDLSGLASLCAYTVGVEVECKLANLVSIKHYEHGWHATAVLGALGSAAACSWLLGLSPGQTRHALGIVSSMAGGVRANFGTMTKPLHTGQAARNGVMAALLAENGFTGNPAVLEASKGVIEVFELGDSLSGEDLTDRLGQPFHLLSPGVSIKRFPTCSATHLCLEAVLELRRCHELPAERIEKVECGLHELDYQVLLRPEGIRAPEQARFSLEFAAATALLNGEVILGHFTESTIQRADVQTLMGKVHLFVPAELRGFESRRNRFGFVKIHLSDGTTISHKATVIRGHPPFLLSDEEIDSKFLGCVTPVLGSERAQRFLERVREIEKLSKAGQLFSPA